MARRIDRLYGWYGDGELHAGFRTQRDFDGFFRAHGITLESVMAMRDYFPRCWAVVAFNWYVEMRDNLVLGDEVRRVPVRPGQMEDIRRPDPPLSFTMTAERITSVTQLLFFSQPIPMDCLEL